MSLTTFTSPGVAAVLGLLDETAAPVLDETSSGFILDEDGT